MTRAAWLVTAVAAVVFAVFLTWAFYAYGSERGLHPSVDESGFVMGDQWSSGLAWASDDMTQAMDDEEWSRLFGAAGGLFAFTGLLGSLAAFGLVAAFLRLSGRWVPASRLPAPPVGV